MAREFQEWPAMYYGPKGEAQVFESADDVPKGWKNKPTDTFWAVQGGVEVSEDTNALVAELQERLVEKEARISELEEALERASGANRGPSVDVNMDNYESIREIKEGLERGEITVDDVARAEAERAKPRQGVLDIIEKARQGQTDADSMDEVLTREEAIVAIREAGVEIDANATDAEIEAALTKLEA